MLGGLKITLADVVVFALCELVAIPLCDASWHAIVTEDQIVRGIIGLSAGIPIGLVGFTFHWWRDNARQYVIKLGKDWWPLPFAILIIWVINPVYFAQFRRFLPWVGPIVWNIDEPNNTGFFIGMQQQAGQPIRVMNFQAIGQNTSAHPITNIEGYIKSTTTNKELPIYLVVMENQPNFPIQIPVPEKPKNTYGIPPYATFSVTTAKTAFPNIQTDGMSVSEFLSDFSDFEFVFKYDDYIYRHHFTVAEVKKQFDTFSNINSPDKSTTPRITRKDEPQTTYPDVP